MATLLGRWLGGFKAQNTRLLPAVEEAARQAESLYQRGSRAFAEQRYSDSVSFALQAIALDQNLAGIHFLLGSALFELAEFGKAEDAFSACLALGPGYPLIQHAHARWALSQVRGGRNQSVTRHVSLANLDKIRQVSIIICSVNPERFERVSANYHALLIGVPHEIIGIHDARSLCEGYNRGVRQANGDLLIFSHDDIEIISPDFAAKLLSYLEQFDLIGVAGTTQLVGPAWVHGGWPHIHGQIGFVNTLTGHLMVQSYGMHGSCTPNAQAMDGVFLAARREVVESIRFDQSTFDGWHLYDIDFTFSAYLAGYRTAICNDICMIHKSSGHWDENWQRYASAFMVKRCANLPANANQEFGELCSTELESQVEWLLMTQAMTQRIVKAAS